MRTELIYGLYGRVVHPSLYLWEGEINPSTMVLLNYISLSFLAFECCKVLNFIFCPLAASILCELLLKD